MSLFLLLITVAIVLGIIGVATHGLFYLLIISVVILVADLVYGTVRVRRRGTRPQRVR
ncbi:hypothetical protein ABZ484_17210 [Streptomyces sp. NPDC006393]|uniref:hypothetical protein n=1 Tax=Streptomyces sp. NPDC006393 TaxID=3156763 RepID=UPI0034051C5E